MKENKKQRLYRTIMLIIVVATITFIVTSITNYQKSIKYLISGKNDSSFAEKLDSAVSTIREVIKEKYIGEIDENNLIEGAVKGMVASLGDIYTEYYTKEELEDFTATTLGNFVGIGVYMQGNLTDNTITIISTIPGSPAEEANLQKGDLILKADGIEYTAESLSELSSHIKGEEGTTVTLTINRNGEIMDVTVKRAQVHINYVTSEMLANNIGYIAIETFDENCASDFIDEYNKLIASNAKALIIDIRDNGGGVVDESIAIADFICDKGSTLLITVDKEGKRDVSRADSEPVVDIPVVVLINGETASASEILAGALKDNNKAELIGEKTFGKGVIQELIPLSNGGAIKVTSAEYLTPSEYKINKVGIEPDYEVIDADEQLEKAIEILKDKIK